MTLKELIRKRIEENVADYDISKIERYEYLFEMIAIEFASEQVKLFCQPTVSGRSEQLRDSLQDQIKRGELDPYSPHAKWTNP